MSRRGVRAAVATAALVGVAVVAPAASAAPTQPPTSVPQGLVLSTAPDTARQWRLDNLGVVCPADTTLSISSPDTSSAGGLVEATQLSLRYTPPAGYEGTDDFQVFAICVGTDPSPDPIFATPFTIAVVISATESSDGAQAQFIPTRAPGPCVRIETNRLVRFGAVELGGPVAQGDVAPVISGCADTRVTQDILVQAGAATDGTAVLAPAQRNTCVVMADCPVPPTGTYRLAVADAVIDNVPTLVFDGLPGAFPARDAPLELRLPAVVDSASVGALFSFPVTFLAVADT
jgi:hypothetical protein